MYKEGSKIDFMRHPDIIWNKEYETDDKKIKMLIQHISDHILYYENFTEDSAKRDENYKIFKGDIKDPVVRNHYKGVEFALGAEGSGKLQDYKFFHQSFNHIEGRLLEAPQEVSFNNVSQSVVDEKVLKSAKIGAAVTRNSALAEVAGETGENMEEFFNREDYVPTTKEQMFEEWNAPQQEEYVLSRLITSFNERYNIKDELNKSNIDNFCANQQFCFIDDSDGEPKLKYIEPKNVGWMSPVKVESMDDPNIIAWGIKDYISLENALRIYGNDLASSSGINGLKDQIKELRKSGFSSLNYNPYSFNLAEYPYHRNYSATTPNSVSPVNWTSKFYNLPFGKRGVYGSNWSLLRHRIFFKLVKEIKAIIQVDGRNPTKEEYSKIEKNIFQKEVTYKLVDDDYKPKASEYVKRIQKEDLYQADRIGHCIVLRIKKCDYQTKYEANIKRVFPPIVGRINYQDSMVDVGKEMWRLYNSYMYKMDELSNLAGADEILVVDKQQMAGRTLKSFLFEAKKAGIVQFDSTLVQDKTNVMAGRHMSKTSLSPSIATINEYFQLASLYKSSFESMIGMNQQVLGQAGKYDGATKINTLIQQASYSMKRYYYNDYLFKKAAYQRLGDFLKVYYGQKDRYFSVFFGKEEYEVLRLTKKLSLYDYESYIDIGDKAIQDRQFLLGIAEQGLSSGATSLRDFVAMYSTKSIQEIKAIMSKGMTELERAQANQQQQQLQINQQRNQIDQASRIDVPLQIEQIRSQSKMDVANIKYQDRRESEAHKADGYDIKEANDRERMILEHELEQGGKDFEAERQAESDLLNNILETNLDQGGE